MNKISHFMLAEHHNKLYTEEAISSISLTRDIADKINELIDAYNNMNEWQLAKHQEQDGAIRKGILYMKDNLLNTLWDLLNNTGNELIKSVVGEYVQTLTSQIENLTGQIKAGSTSMDAEIIDGRVRLSGAIYESIGAAIRSMDKELAHLQKAAKVSEYYHDGMFDLMNWEQETKPYSEYVSISSDKCTITQKGGQNVGISSKRFTLKNPDQKVYVRLNLASANGESHLKLWASEQFGVVTGKSKMIDAVAVGENLFIIDPLDYDFEIKCIWILQNGGDTATTYIYSISDFIVYQNEYQDKGLTGEMLGNYILQMVDKLEEYKTEQKTINGYLTGQKDILTDTSSCLTVWEGNPLADWQYNKTDNSITFQAWHNDGITTPPIEFDSDKLLHIEFDIEHSNSLDTYTVLLYGSDRIGTGGTFKQLETITANGHHHVKIDAAYLSVYDELPIKYIWWVVKASGASDIYTKVSNIHIWQNGLIDNGYTADMSENILKLASELKSAASITNKNYLVTPSGMKYVQQIDDSGMMIPVPVVPAKAFFLGNSLLAGFGYGMAASNENADYYSLINAEIKAQKGTYTASKLQGNPWENAASISEKNNYLSNTLANYLSEDLELVVVQLGDNVNTDAKITIFEQSAIELLRFIRSKAPKSRVVWVGAWYQTVGKMEIMTKACQETGCEFINIWDLNTASNQAKIGDTYTLPDGEIATITDAGIASHPNDKGHKAIAGRVLHELGIKL